MTKSHMGPLAIDYDLLADKVAERLAPLFAGGQPRYASAVNNPLGSPRAFLDAHRAGRFTTFKRGREVLALWSDVEAYIEGRRTKPRERRYADAASLAGMAPGRRRRAA